MRLFVTLASVVTGILLGMPIAFALMLVGIGYIILFVPFGFAGTPQQIFDSTSSFALLALPLFMLVGEIMAESGIARRIVNFTSSLVGHWRGGVGHVSVLANAGMGGISGSESADIAALGRVFIPGMTRLGYGRVYATAIVGAAAVLAPILPPSIPMILYGSIAGVSIGGLFLGGVIPGLMLIATLMTTNAIIARRRGFPAAPRASAATIARTGASVSPIAVLPLLIIGGIVSGMVTPTEAGALALVASLVLGFAYRGLTITGVGHVLARFADTLGPLMVIIATAGLFSFVLNLEQTGPRLVSLLEPIIELLGGNELAVLLPIIGSVLLLGCIIESITLLIVLGPIMTLAATGIGLDPVHFGVCFVLAVMIGTHTPPLGYALMVGARVGRVDQDVLIKEMLLFIPAMIAVLVAVCVFPALATFLPDLLLGGP